MEADLDLPVLKGMRRVHALNFFEHRGAIWVKWKQYMTSETWSTPVNVIPPKDLPRVAQWRPLPRMQQFADAKCMHAWVDKFESNLAHSGDLELHQADLNSLRAVIDRRDPKYTT